MIVSPLAGKLPQPGMLVDIPKLITAYYTETPDVTDPKQRVVFGTSGHRGSSLQKEFNEWHILAITQAICLYRAQHHIDGPLFLGMDTHALSVPALASALEVLGGNRVEVMIANENEFTPTPAVSHAILTYNRSRTTRLADGIIITPSHNPPHDGGFKYNPPHGGPAEAAVTEWIETKANQILMEKIRCVKRISLEKSLRAVTTHRHDFLDAYTSELGQIIDMECIRGAKLHLGVDPLGGAGVHYWGRIAERYSLNLTVVSEVVDPTFRFMTVDWDGQIRMDPSSPYAMERLRGMKDQFDIAFACDTDHDRHGIVTKDSGLMTPNHYLSAAVYYLLQHRPDWQKDYAVGKTMVTTQMIDRVASNLGHQLFEVPVGFKWFVGGLLDGSLGFGGEESGGASFARLNGEVWTTDKDGIVAALLAGEITARMGRSPAEIYKSLTEEFGECFSALIEAPATPEQKEILKGLKPEQVTSTELAGDAIASMLVTAPGNGAPLNGLKVTSVGGWFAARPSGTEDIYKIYAESFRGAEHLQLIVKEAQLIVDGVLAANQAKLYVKPRAKDYIEQAKEDRVRNYSQPAH